MTVITPQRQLIGTSPQDMRVETDRMLTRLTQVVTQQGQATGTFVDAAALSPLPDGALTVFTLPTAPNPVLSLQLFADTDLMRQGATADYTVRDRTVTFLVAPAGGVKFTAWYRTQ